MWGVHVFYSVSGSIPRFCEVGFGGQAVTRPAKIAGYQFCGGYHRIVVFRGGGGYILDVCESVAPDKSDTGLSMHFGRWPTPEPQTLNPEP